MKREHRWTTLIWAISCLVFLAVMMVPAAANNGDKLTKDHLHLLKMAAEAPEQEVALIVKKAGRSDQAEELVAGLGGRVTRELHMINGFSAELAAGAALELADSQAVRWVFLYAPVETHGDGGE